MKRHTLCKGFTMLELIISCAILGMLLTVAFMIWRMGASAWLKSDAKTELLQIAQMVTARVNREVEGSSFNSASLAPDGSGVAFLNAKNSAGVFVYDPVSLGPRWQNYVVLYFVQADKTLYRRQISVAGGPQESGAMPIDSLGQGPVEDHFTGGQPIGTGLDECRFAFTPEEQLLLEMSSSKRRYGSGVPERQTIRVVTAFRN